MCVGVCWPAVFDASRLNRRAFDKRRRLGAALCARAVVISVTDTQLRLRKRLLPRGWCEPWLEPEVAKYLWRAGLASRPSTRRGRLSSSASVRKKNSRRCSGAVFV